MSLEKQINKSFSANSIFLKASFSQGPESFSKISPIKVPNTEGQCPIIVFKKQTKIPSFYDLAMKETGYITDGGLKKKLQRFESSKSFYKQNHKIFRTSLKQKSTFPNYSAMNKGKYSQSMRNINPKKSTDIKLHSKPNSKVRNTNMIEPNPSTSQKGNYITSSKSQTFKQKQCLTPEIKFEQMEGLIEKGVASKIRDIQSEKVRKTREEELNEKKYRYLEDNGIQIEYENLGNDEEESGAVPDEKEEGLITERPKGNEYDNTDNPENTDEPKKMSKTNRTFTNSALCSTNNIKARIGSSSTMRAIINYDDSKIKKILKPRIDHFEYLNKINNELRIRSREYKYSESKTNSNLQNSFRRSNSNNNDMKVNKKCNKNIQADSKNSQAYDDDPNFLFSYHTNHRSEQELAHFILSKRIQEQEKEVKENFENNQKTFLIFRNLYILTQRLQQKSKKRKPKKIKNEFYVGTQSNHNLSTVIDPNDYYYSVLEGQKLIVKTNFEQDNEYQRTRNSNISHEEINRITKNSINDNNNISARQFGELKNKVAQTILRANKLFSQDNIDQYFQSEYPKKIEINNSIEREYADKEKGKDKDKVNNTHSTQRVVSIENTSSYNGTKNLPSLSHTYTNSNTSPNKKNIIEPRAILNLVEIIKILTQRKVFYMLYEDYFNEKMIQRYTIAFIYFNAVLKQRTFHRIEAFAHYKTYYYACSQLFLPFKRKQFEYFVSNCFFKKKVQYLSELLNHIFKKKVIERIYVYGATCMGDEEIAFYNVFMKIMQITIRPKLQEAFEYFVRKALEFKSKEEELREAELKEVELKEAKLKEVKLKEAELKEAELKEAELKELSCKNYNEYEERKVALTGSNNESEMEEMDMSDRRAYTYDTCSEKSGNTLEPNSLDSDRLHRVIIMNLKQKELMYDLGYSNEEIEEHDNLMYSKHRKKRRKGSSKENSVSRNSISSKSVKSLKDICQMKPGIKGNKCLDDLQKSLSNRSIQDSLGSKLNYLKKSSSKGSLDNSKDKDSRLNTSKSAKLSKGEDNLDIDENKYDWSNNKLKEDLALSLSENKRVNCEKEQITTPEYNQETDKSIQIKVDTEEEARDRLINSNIKRKDIRHPTSSEPDISAEKDIKDNIEWEISLSISKSLINDKKDNESNNVSNPTSNNSDNKILNIIKTPKEETTTLNEAISKPASERKNDTLSSNLDMKLETQKINKEVTKEIAKNQTKKEDSVEEINPKNSNEGFLNDKIELTKEDQIHFKNDNQTILSPINKTSHINEKPSLIHKSPGSTDSYNDEFEKGNINEIEDNINNTEENIVNIIQSEEKEISIEQSVLFQNLSEKDIDAMIVEILQQIVQSEIKDSNKKIIPYKTFKMEPPQIPLSTSNSHSFPHPDCFDDKNISFLLNSSYYSIFSKSVKDKKKDKSLHLYKVKIFPKLLEQIRKEIIANYPKIYKNLKTSIKSNPIGLMTSLSLEDADMLRENYKRLPLRQNEIELLDKEKILREYEVINKKIRFDDNIIGDNYYDNMLNRCVVETAIEIMQKERLYGEMGEPLPWSIRLRELNFKYPKDDPTKLVNYIKEQLILILDNKIGLITDNYEHMDSDQLNMEREKRLINNITNELNEADPQWINLEMEETQTKIEANKLLLDQLYNEVIEILEHIQYSRKCPELYQNKSIYACEEIPKLTFQMTSTDNDDDEDNELINI